MRGFLQLAAWLFLAVLMVWVLLYWTLVDKCPTDLMIWFSIGTFLALTFFPSFDRKDYGPKNR